MHPGWPALVGRTPVLASYRDIFRNPAQDAVTARDEQTLIEGADGRVFCVEEVGGGLLLATNWFRLDRRALAARAPSGEPARAAAARAAGGEAVVSLRPSSDARGHRLPQGRGQLQASMPLRPLREKVARSVG